MEKIFIFVALFLIQLLNAGATEPACNECITEEEPYITKEREATTYFENLVKNGTDQERWSYISLYSESKLPEHLRLQMIKKSGLWMSLEPKNGVLTIEKNGLKQAFKIGPTQDSKNACPVYDIKIIEAYEKYAIIRMRCHKFEYRPNSFNRSVDYFLYDMSTADMRSIWSSWMFEGDKVFPDAEPIPTIKQTPKGYRIDWTGINMGDPKRKKFSLHADYLQKINRKTGKLELLCVNAEAKKGESSGGPCEGPIVPLILDERKTEQ